MARLRTVGRAANEDGVRDARLLRPELVGVRRGDCRPGPAAGQDSAAERGAVVRWAEDSRQIGERETAGREAERQRAEGRGQRAERGARDRRQQRGRGQRAEQKRS